MDYSMPGSPVIHWLPELAHIYVHWVSNVVRPSHPVAQPSPFAFSFSSGSFAMTRLLASGGQNIGASASASVLRMSIQCWFPFRWAGLISLQSKRLSSVFSSTTIWKHQFFCCSAFQLSHLYLTTGKTKAVMMRTFVAKVMSCSVLVTSLDVWPGSYDLRPVLYLTHYNFPFLLLGHKTIITSLPQVISTWTIWSWSMHSCSPSSPYFTTEGAGAHSIKDRILLLILGDFSSKRNKVGLC